MTEFRASFDEFEPLDFGDLRQCHRTTDGMAEKGAGVNRLASGHGPRGLHHIRPTHAGRKRKSSRQRFAEADHIRHHTAVFAGEPFAGASEAGVNLVEDE